MVIVGMAAGWFGYTLTLWGYTLVRGPDHGFTGGPLGGGWSFSKVAVGKWKWPKNVNVQPYPKMKLLPKPGGPGAVANTPGIQNA